MENAAAIDYLATTRGLSWDNVQYFRLGVVDDPLPGHESYRGMLSIPYTAPNGDTLSIRFRQPTDDFIGPKYLTLPGDTPRLYNTSALDRHEDFMCLTEGEIDTATAHQIGLPSIGIPGVQAWKPEWALIFKPYRVTYVFTDGDEPGDTFGRMIAEQVPNARPISMGRWTNENGEDKSCDVNKRVQIDGPDWVLGKVKR